MHLMLLCRGAIDAVFDSLHHLIVDASRFLEALSAVNERCPTACTSDALLISVNSGFVGGDIANERFRGLRRDRVRAQSGWPLRDTEADDGLAADAVDFTPQMRSSLCCWMRSRSVAMI